jgi:hypothetical protein
VPRRIAAANLDVVAVEGDVDGAERGGLAGALFDESPQPAGKWTPVWIPTSATRARSGFASMISCAIRERVRRKPSASSRILSAAMGAGAFIRLLSGLTGPG